MTDQFLSNPVWSREGHVVRRNVSPDEAIREARIDWEVVKKPLFFENGVEFPLCKALIRSDNGENLGYCTPTYRPFQNRDAFEFLEKFTQSGEITIDSVVSSNKGKMVTIVSRINQPTLKVFNTNHVELFFVISNNHSAKRAVTLMITPIVIECNNKIPLAISESLDLRVVPHNANLEARIAEARELINFQKGTLSEGLEVYKDMLRYNLPSSKVQEYLYSVFSSNYEEVKARCIEKGVEPPEFMKMQIVKQVLANFTRAEEECPESAGTIAQAFNAITRHYSNGKTQTNSLLYGRANTKIKEALQQARVYMR